jgi:hypothetical protein
MSQITTTQIQRPIESDIYPGLSRSMSLAFAHVGRTGRNPDWNRFNVRRVKYFHRQVFSTGTSDAVRSLSFFGANQALAVTNIPQQGRLDQDTALWLQAVRVVVDSGVDATGAGQATGAQSTNSNTATAVAELIRIIIKTGTLTLRVGDRDVVTPHGVYGLEAFPAGGGVQIDAALATTATSASHQIAGVNNGAPFASNAWLCQPWFPVLPGKPIVGNITWPVNIQGIASTTITCRMELEGLLVSPANL